MALFVRTTDSSKSAYRLRGGECDFVYTHASSALSTAFFPRLFRFRCYVDVNVFFDLYYVPGKSFYVAGKKIFTPHRAGPGVN